MLNLLSGAELWRGESRRERRSEIGRSCFEAALQRYGLDDLPPEAGALTLPTGCERTLDRSAAAPLAWRKLTTTRLDEFKSWVGVPDEAAVPAAEPGFLGSGPAVRGAALDAPQWRELRRAAYQYLFADSRPVAAYRDAIERYLGPFAADLWLAERIVIEAGAALVIRRRPTALLVGELELHAGGRICLHSVASLAIGALRKLDLRH